MAKLTGRIFLERNTINLYANILDTPEFFWEAEASRALLDLTAGFTAVSESAAVASNCGTSRFCVRHGFRRWIPKQRVRFEPLYRRMSRYLDVEDRVAILNNRLDIIKDLLDSLGSQLEIREAHRLEKTIIWCARSHVKTKHVRIAVE